MRKIINMGCGLRVILDAVEVDSDEKYFDWIIAVNFSIQFNYSNSSFRLQKTETSKKNYTE